MVRGFRAVAALTAGQLVTSWIHASLSLGEARDMAQRQLDAQQRNKGDKVCAPRVPRELWRLSAFPRGRIPFPIDFQYPDRIADSLEARAEDRFKHLNCVLL